MVQTISRIAAVLLRASGSCQRGLAPSVVDTDGDINGPIANAHNQKNCMRMSGRMVRVEEVEVRRSSVPPQCAGFDAALACRGVASTEGVKPVILAIWNNSDLLSMNGWCPVLAHTI